MLAGWLRLLAAMCTAAVACNALSCGAPPAHSAAQRAAPGDLAIVGATVVPMDRPGVLRGRTVLVRGARIVAVAPAGELDTSAATVIDGRGKWLVPGLADMHVHTWSDADLGLFLLNGVTTVRNMFGSPMHLVWRAAIAAGKKDGPTLITTGPIIDGDPPFWPDSTVVKSAAEGRAAVRAHKQAGYDWIKIFQGLSREAYDAIIDEARIQKIPVAGHVPKAVGIEGVLASSQRSIEHLDGYVPMFGPVPPSDGLVAATVKAGVWNCPTLVVVRNLAAMEHPDALAAKTRGLDLVDPAVRAGWDPKGDFRFKQMTPERFAEMRAKSEQRRALVAKLAAAGAKLVLGTDTGNPFVVPGFAVHQELALLVGAGLSPWQALRAATAAAAELQGTPGAFGVIRPGARADLLLVDRDPLADIGALADPPIVIVRGRLHRRREMLAAARRAVSPVAPADRFAALGPLEAEGRQLAAADYAVSFRGREIGAERAILSRAADGTRVVRGQVVYWAPRKLSLSYRATRDSVTATGDELPGGVTAVRSAARVTARLGTGAPIELATAADAIVAPQAVAEFFWYAGGLADLAVGSSRTIPAAEVATDAGLRLDPARYTFTRRPDEGGRRAYELAGTSGTVAVKGRFTVDADGAPADVIVTFPFGAMETRRSR